MHLYESELSVLEVVWEQGELTAAQIAKILNQKIGWARNTTYTVILKCITKGYLLRVDPGFRCSALIAKETAQKNGIQYLLESLFEGSMEKFMCAFVGFQSVNTDEKEKLKKMIDDME